MGLGDAISRQKRNPILIVDDNLLDVYWKLQYSIRKELLTNDMRLVTALQPLVNNEIYEFML